MSRQHYPAKCPKCKSDTEIIYGNGYAKDEIKCTSCEWSMRLMTSTVLGLNDKIGMIIDKVMKNRKI